MGEAEHSGAVLIIKKKANSSVGVSGFNERKRSRVVLSDSESGDDLNTFPTVSVSYKKDSLENKDSQTEKKINNGLVFDERKITKDASDNKRDLYSENKSSRLSISNDTDEEDLDENGILRINKHKPIAKASDLKESRTRVLGKKKLILAHKPIVEDVKPIKRASFTEKQLLREKIKKMLLSAGWTIDYRPRRTRDYLDSVYISPSGTGYWSITKAYNALQKEDKDSQKAGVDFTPLPNEILNKLTRQTRKKIEREMQKNQSNIKKSKLRNSSDQKKFGSYLKEVSQDSDDSSDNSQTKIVRTNSQIVHGRKNGEIGRRTLLGRGSDKGVNSETNEFIPFSGKRTLLSWLIDSGTVSVGEKVEYMNLRKTRVMQEGWITRNGIHCGCCSKIVTITRFELHAGSKLGKPFQNIFMVCGRSLMECLIDGWNKQEEVERKGFHSVDVDGDDPNDDTCRLCGDGGDLICCDGCPSVFHLSCLDMQMLPQGDWHCPDCTCKYCQVVGGTETSLVTCRLCEKKYHKLCNTEIDEEPVDSNDLCFPFCGNKCRELYCNLQKLLWTKHELDSGLSWSLISRTDPLPDVSSLNYSQRAECNSKLAVARLVMDECFLPIVDRRSGINVIHNVVYNCGSNFSRLNYNGFLTAILERGDEIVCAAPIRIHGTQVAEMPFIGTRDMYRRQGMCRRLLHAIQSALSSLKIEKLVIPAIEEHLHTWTNAFGFSPIVESCKREMTRVNLLVFPGTEMLQKLLIKKKITSTEGKKSKSNGIHCEPEIRLSRKKSVTQSNGNGLRRVILDGNEGIGIGIGMKYEPQLEVIASISVQNATDLHSSQPPGIPLETNLRMEESASMELHIVQENQHIQST